MKSSSNSKQPTKTNKYYFDSASYLPRIALMGSAAYLLYTNVAGFKEISLAFNAFALASPLLKFIYPKTSIHFSSFAITNIIFESSISYLFPNWIYDDISRICLSFLASYLILSYCSSVAKMGEQKEVEYVENSSYLIDRLTKLENDVHEFVNTLNLGTKLENNIHAYLYSLNTLNLGTKLQQCIHYASYSLKSGLKSATFHICLHSACMLPFWLYGIDQTMGLEYICSSVIIYLLSKILSYKEASVEARQS